MTASDWKKILKQLIRNKKYIFLLVTLLVLFPIFFQYKIIKENYNLNKMSIISTLALNDYFLTYVELEKRGLLEDRDSKYSHNAAWVRSLRRGYFSNMIKNEGYPAAVRKVKNELKVNIKYYPAAVISVFIDLIFENSMQSSHFLREKNNNNMMLVIISLWQSRFLLLINIFSIGSFLVIFLNKSIPQKKYFFILNFNACIVILFIYISSGVSIGQGDRFIVPIYFFSIIWFFFQLNTVFSFLKKRTMEISRSP